jgi:hypothetical protein
MAQVPLNEKLYAMVVTQAKAKYRIYPSPGASHWVHRRYLELGGKFEDTSEKTRREKVAKRVAENRMLEKRGSNDRSAKMDEKKHKERTGYDKKKTNLGKKTVGKKK